MMKIRTLLAVGVFLSLSCSASLGQSPPFVTIHATSSADDGVTPVLYAEQAGLFRKVGIEVVVQKANSGSAVAAAVASGAMDIGRGSLLPIINAYVRGIHFVIIAPSSVHVRGNPDSAILVATDSTIRSARELNGKVVSVPGLFDLSWLATKVWLDANGTRAPSMLPSTPTSWHVSAGSSNKRRRTRMRIPRRPSTSAADRCRGQIQTHPAAFQRTRVALNASQAAFAANAKTAPTDRAAKRYCVSGDPDDREVSTARFVSTASLEPESAGAEDGDTSFESMTARFVTTASPEPPIAGVETGTAAFLAFITALYVVAASPEPVMTSAKAAVGAASMPTIAAVRSVFLRVVCVFMVVQQ